MSFPEGIFDLKLNYEETSRDFSNFYSDISGRRTVGQNLKFMSKNI